MPVLPKRLPEAGQYASLFRWLNSLRAYVESLKPLQSAGTLTTHGPHGVSRTSAGGAAGAESPPVTVKQLRVKDATTSGIYIKCVSFNAYPSPGVEGSEYIYVARPFKLRTSILNATIDGVLVSYTYPTSKVQRTVVRPSFTSGGQTYPAVTEIQKIVPRFLVDDVIYAVEVDDESNLNMSDPDGNPITHVDLNLDARAWCRAFVQ